MAKKFSARYTNDDELSRMVRAMKVARKSTGYSQDNFGKLIGISRETVVHIEGLVECTVLSLECEVLKRWYAACASKISEYERENLQTAITEYLFSSAYYLSSYNIEPNHSHNNSHSIPKMQQQKVA